MQHNVTHSASTIHGAGQIFVDVGADWHRTCRQIARVLQQITVNKNIATRLRLGTLDCELNPTTTFEQVCS